MFLDQVEITVEAGKGGDGCVSFRRERYIPRGGPDGGDGGNGGSIIMVAEEGVDSLIFLGHKPNWKADKGNPGEGNNRHGKSAKNLTLRVPPGTTIYDCKEDIVLKDMTVAGESVVVARGGKGGKGNTRFKSSTHQTPRERTRGTDGEERRLRLELKVIADVGLVGKPNAGKSTLLSRLSHARPQIADYPFTTKFPNLGRVAIDMDNSFVMADIPGLIEGASDGIGLGHEFLRHIERSGILIHLVEPAPMDGSDPIENYVTILEELRQYDADLAARPTIVCVTKAELPEAEEVAEKLREMVGDVLLISAVTGQGLNLLVAAVAKHLKKEEW